MIRKLLNFCLASVVTRTVAVVGFVAVAVAPRAGLAQERRPGTALVIASVQAEEQLGLGKAAYGRYCVGCHGDKGDGQGPAARWLFPKPRDFTQGVYKFRTTPSGSVPTDGDLLRTITEGVHGTSMPSWQLVSERERQALVAYIKTFSPKFNAPGPRAQAITIPAVPVDLASYDRVKLGRTLYRAMGCHMCHGQTGGGDGPSSGKMKDDWGQPIKVANFQRGILRGGRTAQDVYRTMAAGIGGTPMPGFAGTMADEKLWAIVSYVRYLMKNQSDPKADDVLDPCVAFDTCETVAAATPPGTSPAPTK